MKRQYGNQSRETSLKSRRDVRRAINETDTDYSESGTDQETDSFEESVRLLTAGKVKVNDLKRQWNIPVALHDVVNHVETDSGADVIVMDGARV